ncbi:MAG: hemolysin family protein [Chlamydiota bacterium]|nr:hemolysin family protein [Chlamydiota bacterium]
MMLTCLVLMIISLAAYMVIPFSEKALVSIQGLYEQWRSDLHQKETKWYTCWKRHYTYIWLSARTSRVVILIVVLPVIFLLIPLEGGVGLILKALMMVCFVFLIIFSEFLARGLQPRVAYTFAPFAVRYLFFLSWLLYPLHLLMRRFAPVVLRVMKWGGFQIVPWHEDSAFERLQRIQGEAGNESVERILINKVFELGEKWVRDIMIPRLKMCVLPVTMTIRQILMEAQAKGYSRFPVLKDNPDEIAGVLNIKDIFKVLDVHKLDEELELSHWVRTPFYIPETKRIRELMLEFQYKKRHMALVVDEYGSLVGLVTREDLYQDFLSEFHDLPGDEEDLIQHVDSNIFIAKAEVALDDLEDQLDFIFPQKRDYTTLGGFLLSQIGHVPQIGEEISFNGWDFQITDASEKTIQVVRISRSA